MSCLCILIPLRTINPLNNRQHWRLVSKRGKSEKQTTTLYLNTAKGSFPALPVRVVLIRIGKRLMDSDGLTASMKHVRDSVAKKYGRDDKESCFEWVYEQRIGKEYGVEILVSGMQ